MKNNTASAPMSRADILAAIVSLPHALQGKICEDRRTLANGTTAVYHNLQYWADGRNHTVRIPEDRFKEFEDGVANGKRAKDLLVRLTEVDARAIASAADPLKKNSSRSRSKARPKSAR